MAEQSLFERLIHRFGHAPFADQTDFLERLIHRFGHAPFADQTLA
jgi:hypothetical protein